MIKTSSCSHPLVLASASPYRRELLSRLGLAFTCHSPGIDESAHSGESAMELVLRLSEQKARAVGKIHTDAVVIGSDQVALLEGQILPKPGNRENARKQLQTMSGRQVVFNTGLCVLVPGGGAAQTACIPCSVTFRSLESAQIDRYVELEQPFDCAGSFKSEGMGITLLEKMEGEDPTALIGLPLIRLSEMLRNAGFSLP